jgi:hypothetical protein
VNVSSTLHPAWLAAAGVMLLVGLWLLRRGWRGRRVGDEPFCTKCGYSLVGSERIRCSECGADVSGDKSVQIGQLTWRPRSIVCGAAMAVIALTVLSIIGWPRLRDFDWYTLKPTGWVLDDLASAKSPKRGRALAEVLSRLKAAPLAKRHHDRLVEIAIAEQAGVTRGLPSVIVVPRRAAATKPTWPPIPPFAERLISWADYEAEEGRLNPNQLARLCEGSQLIRIVARPRVVQGNLLSYSVQREVVSEGYSWYVRAADVSVTVDGHLVPLGESAKAAIELRLAHHISLGADFDGYFQKTTLSGLGPHQFVLKTHVEIWSVARPGKEKRLIHGFDARTAATVQVVSSESDR